VGWLVPGQLVDGLKMGTVLTPRAVTVLARVTPQPELARELARDRHSGAGRARVPAFVADCLSVRLRIWLHTPSSLWSLVTI